MPEKPPSLPLNPPHIRALSNAVMVSFPHYATLTPDADETAGDRPTDEPEPGDDQRDDA